MKKMLCLIICLSSLGLFAQTPEKSGDMAYYARDYQPAQDYYAQAIVDDPENLGLQSKLANCFRIMGKFKEARKYYAIINKNDSASSQDRYRYANVLKSLGQYKSAKKILKQNSKEFKQALASCQFAMQYCKMKRSLYIVTREDSISHDKYDDYAPSFHLDAVVFASSRKVKIANMGYSNPPTDNYLYTTESNKKGELSNPSFLQKNTQMATANLAPIALQKDKNILISSFNQFMQGIRHVRDAGLHKLALEYIELRKGGAQLGDVGQSFPFAEYINHGFPAFSSDGEILYFAAEKMEGIPNYGGMDIYSSTFENSRWTKPKNIGPNINTTGDEICPFVDSNNVLYFTSDVHKGFGGYDVYKTTQKKETWAKPTNLGPKVNSSRDDLYFIFDANKQLGYFSSDRKGNLDIYRVELKAK